MSDRTLTIVFVGVGFLVSVGVAAWNSMHGHPFGSLLDKSMILAAALLPSPLSKTAVVDGPIEANVINPPDQPIPVEPGE